MHTKYSFKILNPITAFPVAYVHMYEKVYTFVCVCVETK